MKNILITLTTIATLPSTAIGCCGDKKGCCEKKDETTKVSSEKKINSISKCNKEECIKKLEEAFNAQDTDKDGKITFEELKVMMKVIRSQKEKVGSRNTGKKCTKCDDADEECGKCEENKTENTKTKK